jgi:hypothetical protein
MARRFRKRRANADRVHSAMISCGRSHAAIARNARAVSFGNTACSGS